MNELLLLSGCGTYMEELIKIPEYTTIVYLSSLIEELSLVKMAKINKELATIDYNGLSNIINNQEQLIINILPDGIHSFLCSEWNIVVYLEDF